MPFATPFVMLRPATRRRLIPLSSLLLSTTLLAAQSPATVHPKDPVTRESPQVQGSAQTGAAHSPNPGSVALSPDGSLVAWTLRGPAGNAIHLTPSAGNSPETTVSLPGTPACSYTSPLWSPDGQTLAFLTDCAPLQGKQTKGQLQIYLWSRTSGQTRQLTHLTGELQQPAWSPDGKALAFLFVENASRSAGALDAMKPFAGVIGEDGVEIQRVYAVSADTGRGSFLTASSLHVYEFDWKPNAQEIAFIAAPPPGENTWWIAELYRQAVMHDGHGHIPDHQHIADTLETTAEPLLDPSTIAGPLHGLQIAVPRFSPDGKHLAFIGGLMSDQGSTGGDLYVLDAHPGKVPAQPVNVTPGIDGTPSYEVWADNNTLGFVEDRRGHTLLRHWNIDTKAAVAGNTLDLGEVSVGGGPIKDAVSYVARNGGLVAFTEQGFSKAPEVYTLLGAAGLRQLTHLHPDAVASTRTESVEWTNGAFHVQGWLTFPRNYDPSRKYPIIVSVHGGPSASIGARWSASNLWADHGYFELQPNPRGSFGQGEAFTEANRKDFGYGDLHDIEAGLDFVEAKYPIDHSREGITGWSYGGFMTMFSVTQTHRFRAAVAGAGLSDWLSYYGENSIDQWMLPFFGASVYDDPAIYARSSAITFIKNVTTPTLVVVGDRDGECPAPQSFEFWHALRDLGVKTQLVVYPDEGHGFRNPEHIRDRDQRAVQWFNNNMPAQRASEQ